MTSSNWFFPGFLLLVQTGFDKFKLVLHWLWLAQTGSSLAVTSSNQFLLVVETGCDWLKLAQTSSSWLLKLTQTGSSCMTSKFICMEKMFSLPPARNYQVHSKSFMADTIKHKQHSIMKLKLIQRQHLRVATAHLGHSRVLIQQVGTRTRTTRRRSFAVRELLPYIKA